MKFVEPAKTGKVLGNDVKATPIPMAEFTETNTRIQAAESAGDSTAIMEAVADVVRKHVTMADDTPIDTAELSAAALKDLYAFAVGLGAEGVADFTPSP